LNQEKKQFAQINENIRARELRVIGADGANFGVISLDEAVKRAQDAGLDLILISSSAKNPIAKIADYGKFQYDQKKKQKEIKAKAHTTETKNVQVKIGTGERDLQLKAERTSEWLKEGHRVKLDLYLRGRAKYMDKKFLEERMHRMLKLITEKYKIAEGPQKSPKGLTLILEREK